MKKTTTAVVAATAFVSGAVALSVSATATAADSAFYVDPATSSAQWVAANPGDSRAPVIRDRIASVPQARWFTTTNTSTVRGDYRWTADEVAYAKAVLGQLGDSRLEAVVDTSRNGKGPVGTEWCDPAGRAIGTPSTTSTGDSAIAAFLWVELPGEADGCIAPAGQFVPQRAYDLAIAAGPTSTTTTTSSSNNPGSGCTVTHRVVSQWSGGYTGEIVMGNRGPSIDGWVLTFSAPGVSVTQGWNGTWNDTGDVVRVTNASWNGTLATGGQTTIGYNANYNGATPPLSAATLNGTACS